MGIYSAKGEFLSRFLAPADEGGVCKAPIIAVVMGDLDAVLGGETLERALGIDGLRWCRIQCHQVDILKAGEMVHKNGGVLVAHLGEASLCLAIETRLSRLKVVNWDTLPRLGGDEDRMLGLLLFAPPRELCHGPKKATCAPEGTDGGKLLWDLTVLRELAERGKGGMAKAVMPSH
jgi:hypothetical protein